MVQLQGVRGGRSNNQRGRGRQTQARGGVAKGGRASSGFKPKNSRGGRGQRGGGRGGRGGGRGNAKPKSKEDLDKELDAYVLGDSKHAQTKLNSELDEYFAQKGKKSEAKAGEEKPAEKVADGS